MRLSKAKLPAGKTALHGGKAPTATFYGINFHHGPLKATKEWNQGCVGGQVLHSEVQEQGVSTPMLNLGPNPKATGLLNCILKPAPASILFREGVSSCLAAGMVTQLPLNLGKRVEDRGRCLASSSSSRHPTLSANRLSTRLSLPTQSLGHPCLGFPSQPRLPFCWVQDFLPTLAVGRSITNWSCGFPTVIPLSPDQWLFPGLSSQQVPLQISLWSHPYRVGLSKNLNS